MILIKPGKKPCVWKGRCKQCEAEFEANEDELVVFHSCEGGHAVYGCSECGAGSSVIFYPKRPNSLQPIEC